MKTVSSKTLCEVYNKDDKLVLRGEFETVCRKLFGAGIIKMFPEKCYTKLDNKNTVRDWSKIAYYIDEILEDGFRMIIGDELSN